MSEDLDQEQFRPMVDAILSAADLEKITVKRIRNAISELFAVDLLPHKKQMNAFILDRYYRFQEEQEAREKEEMEQKDRLLAEKLSKTDSSRRVSRRAAAPARTVKRKTLKREGKPPNTAFNQEQVLSPQLQVVVGAERLSRPQVVKQIWAYIKENELQDPNDKRKIHCDDKLRDVFKKSSVGMFEMNKLLGNHLYKEEELQAGSTDGVKSETNELSETNDEKEVKEESEVSDVDD